MTPSTNPRSITQTLLGFGPSSSSSAPNIEPSPSTGKACSARPQKRMMPDYCDTSDTVSSSSTLASPRLGWAGPRESLPVRSDDFYFDDGNIVFLVGDRLFKVHKHFFTKYSEVFQGMFTVPGPEGTPQDGSSDSQPLRLEGTSSVEFERFLSVIYPATLGLQPYRTTEEWSSIAFFAHKFMFDDLERAAIKEVTERTDDPVAQVFLGRQIKDDALLRKGYRLFAARTDFLSQAEAARLGLAEAVNLTHFRELARMCKNGRINYKEPIDDLIKPTGLQWNDLDELMDQCLPYYKRASLD